MSVTKKLPMKTVGDILELCKTVGNDVKEIDSAIMALPPMDMERLKKQWTPIFEESIKAFCDSALALPKPGEKGVAGFKNGGLVKFTKAQVKLSDLAIKIAAFKLELETMGIISRLQNRIGFENRNI